MKLPKTSTKTNLHQRKEGESQGLPTFQFKDQRPRAHQHQQLLQMMQNSPVVQRQAQARANIYGAANRKTSIQRKKNNTGLPNTLKSGVENLSGLSMDDVKVHYNSNKPQQLQAHAYAQGTDIHLAAGQEKHLPHEAWHVVQQKQGRVKPTMPMKGNVNVNDDKGLEKEADVMGAKAVQMKKEFNHSKACNCPSCTKSATLQLVKRNNKKPKKSRNKDEDWIPNSEKKKHRRTFGKALRRRVIKKAPRNKNGLYVCPGCGMPLADRNGQEIRTYYISKKKKKKHVRVAADLDHYPPWRDRLAALNARNASEEEIRADHDDETRLRPLCHRCNENHKFEDQDELPEHGYSDDEYMSDDSDRDKDVWKRYRDDRDDPGGPPPIAT